MKILFYLIGFIEGIALTYLALALVNSKLDWKKVVMIAIILSASAHLIKALPITFGVHTAVYIGLLIILINFFAKVDLTAAAMAGLITVLTLIIVETAVTGMTLLLLQVTMETFVQNDNIRFFAGLLHVLIIILISIIVRKYLKRGKSGELFKS